MCCDTPKFFVVLIANGLHYFFGFTPLLKSVPLDLPLPHPVATCVNMIKPFSAFSSFLCSFLLLIHLPLSRNQKYTYSVLSPLVPDFQTIGSLSV